MVSIVNILKYLMYALRDFYLSYPHCPLYMNTTTILKFLQFPSAFLTTGTNIKGDLETNDEISFVQQSRGQQCAIKKFECY